MGSALLTIHLIIALALIAVVLLQKSEGGALGMGGGGGGGGGFLTGRGQANLLTRVTAGLAAVFFCTSIALKLYSDHTRSAGGSLFDRTPAGAASPAGGRGGSDLQPIIPLKPATPNPAAAPGAAPGAAGGTGGSSSAPATTPAPAPTGVPQSR